MDPMTKMEIINDSLGGKHDHQHPRVDLGMQQRRVFRREGIFGRHKLALRISPQKTWEGAIGGFIFSLITGHGKGVFPSVDELS